LTSAVIHSETQERHNKETFVRVVSVEGVPRVRETEVFGFMAGVTVDDRTGDIQKTTQTFGVFVRAESDPKTWRELCEAARKSTDPDELLRILRELNKALKRDK
jgi:hypothetical protein